MYKVFFVIFAGVGAVLNLVFCYYYLKGEYRDLLAAFNSFGKGIFLLAVAFIFYRLSFVQENIESGEKIE